LPGWGGKKGWFVCHIAAGCPHTIEDVPFVDEITNSDRQDGAEKRAGDRGLEI
jgi:hypothetical protein